MAGPISPSGKRSKAMSTTPTTREPRILKRKAQSAARAQRKGVWQTQSSSPDSSRGTNRKPVYGTTSALGGKSKIIDLTLDFNREDAECNYEGSETPSKKRMSKLTKNAQGQEKRLKRERKHAPESYLEKLNRALTQRMFVIGRVSGGTPDVPEERIDLAGTTGNIYSINIGKVPNCTCPDNSFKGNQCKHIIYALVTVLKAPEHLQYQLAFLSSELREIFAHAPAPLRDRGIDEEHPGKRKPIEGVCPVCFVDFEPENEELVWCKAACGNNVHRQCFEQWAASQRGHQLRCVYCRTPWEADDISLKNISKLGKVNKDGYVNVAEELGISGQRGKRSLQKAGSLVSQLKNTQNRLHLVSPALGQTPIWVWIA
ncbi:MAG: hypothetical protein M1827_002896 [Pycnora praestabilis]|nr:MAG: hypothetical protein M1827_002896 [Pycnora praestabilis]